MKKVFLAFAALFCVCVCCISAFAAQGFYHARQCSIISNTLKPDIPRGKNIKSLPIEPAPKTDLKGGKPK